MRSQKRWRASWMLLCNAATDLFLLRQLKHVYTPLKITCIPYISLDPYAHVISFYSSSILSWNPAGFAGACYDVDFVMTYGIVWIIFPKVLPLYMIFLCKVRIWLTLTYPTSSDSISTWYIYVLACTCWLFTHARILFLSSLLFVALLDPFDSNSPLMWLPSMNSQTLLLFFCVHHYLLIVVGLVGAQGFRLFWEIIKACPLIPYSMYSCYLTFLNF